MTEKTLLKLTAHDFKLAGFNKAVLPLGSTEGHGEHLPYGSDTFVARHLAEAIANKIDGLLVLPTLPYGMSEHYASFPLTLSLSNDTLVQVLKDLFRSLLHHGIKRLIIINGHDGNISPIDVAARDFRVEHPEMKIAVLEAWWETAGELLPDDTFEVWGGLGHAGEGETSINMAINPELVDMGKAVGVVPKLPEHIDVKWLFHELTPYGVTGDPTKASAEKGVKMIEVLTELLISFINQMDENNWNYG